MGLNRSKSYRNFSLTLTSDEPIYRGLSLIQGEFRLNNRRKLRIEKEIRIDLIGELIEEKKKRIFFTYSSPLIKSHQNGTARTIGKKEILLPFRIPLGINLPPTCRFEHFSIDYHLEVYHDGRVIPNIHQSIILLPPSATPSGPHSKEITGVDHVTIVGRLPKTFYSSRNRSEIPLEISIKNPREKFIQSFQIQLIQMVSLNGDKREYEIVFNDVLPMKIDRFEKEIHQICRINLPENLPSSYVPNGEAQLDSIPSMAITYEFRLIGHIKDLTLANLQLSLPIGIE